MWRQPDGGLVVLVAAIIVVGGAALFIVRALAPELLRYVRVRRM